MQTSDPQPDRVSEASQPGFYAARLIMPTGLIFVALAVYDERLGVPYAVVLVPWAVNLALYGVYFYRSGSMSIPDLLSAATGLPRPSSDLRPNWPTVVLQAVAVLGVLLLMPQFVSTNA